ncbi:CD63 antigen [Pseudolycoriella hygida]|uniref:CD63 antigen n=1 Tax=Pseudolycoriella hygida TaxID=35572 RepID=A0A9Q0RUY9_9DIPT|nr:CD63 antigen [Pseudolycoriella hygida]
MKNFIILLCIVGITAVSGHHGQHRDQYRRNRSGNNNIRLLPCIDEILAAIRAAIAVDQNTDIVAIFGILISNSQNTVLINTYAILLSLALVFHVSAAITGIMLGFCRSKEIVSDTLTAFVHSYEYDAVLRETMDWTQLKFHCCGNSGPEDWIDYFKSIETVEVESSGRDENSTLASTAVTLASDTNTMPSSCCVRDSDYLNLRCENYYEFGCLQHVQEVVSANLLMASFLALGMGLLDLLGAVMGFLITKTIRRERQIDADYNQLGMKSSRY